MITVTTHKVNMQLQFTRYNIFGLSVRVFRMEEIKLNPEKIPIFVVS
jgi:hypothetical protein